jgi:hypothetical protein
MERVVGAIEELRALQRRLPTQEEVDDIIFREVPSGGDAWGSPFLWRTRAESGEISYVLISCGSDHTLDLGDLDAYFKLRETKINLDTGRDIVYRDGRPVTDAGK